jgi:hypothetical protein
MSAVASGVEAEDAALADDEEAGASDDGIELAAIGAGFFDESEGVVAGVLGE